MGSIGQEQHVRRQWTGMMGTLIVALGVLSAPSLFSPPAFAAEDSPCKQVAVAALKACKSDGQAEYWIAVGKCHNLATPQERKACVKQANADRKDNICRDQYEARLEVCRALGGGVYQPVINPADFQQAGSPIPITHSFFPLIPGTTFVYQELDGPEHVEVVVTTDTKEILGVTCVVVRDTVTANGAVTEDTLDWYAQDQDGNVWYFGEESKEYDPEGRLISIDGSWIAGENGALPGIIMKGTPKVGDIYRQEFALGEAEDMAEVLSLTETVTLSGPLPGPYTGCLKTKDFSPLEPDAVENKFFAPGVGQVLTVDIETGKRVELVSKTP